MMTDLLSPPAYTNSCRCSFEFQQEGKEANYYNVWGILSHGNIIVFDILTRQGGLECGMNREHRVDPCHMTSYLEHSN